MFKLILKKKEKEEEEGVRVFIQVFCKPVVHN